MQAATQLSGRKPKPACCRHVGEGLMRPFPHAAWLEPPRLKGFLCDHQQLVHRRLRSSARRATSPQDPQQLSQTPSSTQQQESNPASEPSTSGRHADNGVAAADNGQAAAKGTSKGWRLVDLLPPAASVQLLSTAAQLLRTHFWAVVLIYIVKDGVAFLLHRFSQRLTNMASDTVLGTAICANANPWWLYLESSFLESHLGYQAYIVLFFLLALPLNILLSSAAASAAALLAVPSRQRRISTPPHPPPAAAAATTVQPQTQAAAGEYAPVLSSQSNPGSTDVVSNTSTSEASSSAAPAESSGQQPQQQQSAATTSTTTTTTTVSKIGIVARIKQAIKEVQGVLPEVASILRRVWWVDCLFNMRALPLQALSLLVLPLPWTVPRLLSVQLSVHAAILEGQDGSKALSRSQELMSSSKQLMAAYGWPFVALIIAVRVLDGIRNLVLATLPMRWWQDVVEVPLAITAAFGFAKLLIIRLQDLLPLAAYLMAVRHTSDNGSTDDLLQAGPVTLPPPPTAVPTI